MLVDPFLVFQAHGCNSPWEQIVAAVHWPKEMMLVPPNGLAHPLIADTLQKMKQIAPFATVPTLGGLAVYGVPPIPIFVQQQQEVQKKPAELHFPELAKESAEIHRPLPAIVKRKFVQEKLRVEE
jgi:hypothetical protein